MILRILLCTLVGIAGFGAGWFTSLKVNDVEFLREANEFKFELIEAQDKVLEYSCRIICGKDTTYYEEYENACAKVDSLYYTQL